MEQEKLKPLSEIPSGQKVRLVSIEAGQDLYNRLISMGMLPNELIIVVSNRYPGPFVINVKGSKVMLGRGMAQKIMVSSCDNEKDNSGTVRQS
ncbi:ferrous iron transport protein A [Planctomycetota bacterium]